MGLHDPVTGLPTRRLFLQRARQSLRLADRRETRVAVVVWRPLGPEEGGGPAAGTSHDRAMQETARQLQDNLRASDLVGRSGQKEFILLLTGLEDEDGLRKALERLARRPVSSGGMRLQGRQVEHRVGAALYPDHGARIEDLLTRAREALERAAQESREIRIFQRTGILEEEQVSEDGVPSLPEPGELESAVEEERFVLAFQPIVRLQGRKLEGMEALIQLPRSSAPDVPARSLLPLLREQGLSEAADWLALEGTLRHLSKRTGDRSPPWLSVNMTVETAAAGAFPERLAGLLDGSGAKVRRLVIELTADDARNDPDATRAAMSQLRRAGVRVALDGVGGGPLPLAPLGERPLHYLKLDSSTVRDVHRDQSRSNLVDALVGLGHALGAEVVAEGVESGGELRRLSEAGCDLGQGFHLGDERRPARPDA